MMKRPYKSTPRGFMPSFSGEQTQLNAIFPLLGLILLFSVFSLPATHAQVDNPCGAQFAFFDGSNLVPCGPAANSTPFVDIQTGGAYDPGDFQLAETCGPVGDGGSPAVVYWTTFVVQDGGSFEWQTVPGGDKYYWEMYYLNDPVNTPAEETSIPGCPVTDPGLVFVDCDEEFTGWRVQATPAAGQKWRFFVVYYLRAGDMEGKGVVKLRKSCGEACVDSDLTVDATVNGLSAVCVEDGVAANLNVIPTCGAGGNPTYTYNWTVDPDDVCVGCTVTFSDPFIANPTVTIDIPDGSGPLDFVITASVVGCDGCSAEDQVTITVDCCDVDAGTISTDASSLTIPCNKKALNGSFTASGTSDNAYALILADMSGNILQTSIGTPINCPACTYNGSFNFIGLTPGMYFVYGLSYDESAPQNNGIALAAYLNGKTISSIETDIAGGICADLVSGQKVTIQDTDCGTFAQ